MIPMLAGEAAQAFLRDKTRRDAPDDAACQRERAVADILAEVAADGDAALTRLAERFGDPSPLMLPGDDPQVMAAGDALCPDVRRAMTFAADNIREFAHAVMRAAQPVEQHREGFAAGLRWQPVASAACYVPGGRYPLPSTALMTALTAQVAGVPDITLVSPQLSPAVLYAGRLAGVRRYWRMGGAQAVAALAYGTPRIAAVDIVVGPGNAYVTEAKRQLQGVIGIDMLAGPSEVVVIADAGANPRWVALDLLAQAEHDPDARAYLLSDDPAMTRAVAQALAMVVAELAPPPFVAQSLAASALLTLADLPACIAACNQLAPEHVSVQTRDPDAVAASLTAYGALFLGDASTVPYGDYVAGPNHTLPTARRARFSGGLTPFTFLRPQSWIRADAGRPELPQPTAQLATLEGLSAHAAAARARWTPSGDRAAGSPSE